MAKWGQSKEIIIIYKNRSVTVQCFQSNWTGKEPSSLHFSFENGNFKFLPPGALSFDVKPEIARRITITAVSNELPPGHLLHSFSCNSSLV